MASGSSNKVCNAKLNRLYFDFFGGGLVPKIAWADAVCCKPFSMRRAMISFQRERCLHYRDPWNAECYDSTLLFVCGKPFATLSVMLYVGKWNLS